MLHAVTAEDALVLAPPQPLALTTLDIKVPNMDALARLPEAV